jgi:hypothetical protein
MPPWTKQYVEGLSENELCTRVLIPLFGAMGYQDVRFHGGGALEQGKDITMWRQDPVRGRRNTAVVVKATPITGATTTGTVITQLRQAFGKPFLDVHSGTQQEVHDCFVLTPHEIKKEGLNTLDSLLADEPFRRHVDLIDGPKLWVLIETHLADRVLFDRAMTANEALREVTGEHSLTIKVGEGTREVLVRRDEPVTISPSFPSTPEGRASREAFDSFLRTGDTTELPISGIHGLPLPDYLTRLGFDPSHGVVRFARRGEVSGTLRLIGAKSSVDYPHVLFAITGGTDRIRLSNAHQQIPFVLSSEMAFGPPPEGTLTFRATAAGWSAHWLCKLQQTLELLGSGCEIKFRDHRTGIEHRLAEVAGDERYRPSPGFLDATRRLAWVEGQLEQLIVTPEREFFTEDDIDELAIMEQSITDGTHKLTSTVLRGVFLAQDIRAWTQRTVHQDIQIAVPNYTLPLLDQLLSMGPAKIVGKRVTLSTELPIDDAMNSIEHGEPIALAMTPADTGRIVVRLGQWPRRRLPSARD